MCGASITPNASGSGIKTEEPVRHLVKDGEGVLSYAGEVRDLECVVVLVDIVAVAGLEDMGRGFT